MADVKPEARSETAAELPLLRRAHAEIEARLEAVEEWRALRQLDERERNGNPLEGIDGVLFRGRLVQKLTETSRDWRAYVRIEEAIGQLRGPARLEAGILKETARFEVAKPVAAAPVTGAIPKASPPPATIEFRRAKGTELTADMPPAATAATAETPDDTPEAADQQRVRIKVRAGSSAVSPASATPMPAKAVIVAPIPPARSTEVPPVAALTPRPLPIEPRSTELCPTADPRSPRSVLQRIRVVSKVRSPEASARSGEGNAGLLGAPSAPLIEPAMTQPPQVTPKVPPLLIPASGSGIGHGPAAMPFADTATGDANGTTGPAASIAECGSTTTRATEAATESRLDDLEAELEILIDRSASWPHPLDAHRDRDSDDRSERALERRPPAMLEPDAPVDLDVDEAEVTIIRHNEPVEPGSPVAARAPEPAAKRLKAAMPDPGADTDASRDIDGSDYAGYHLTLEEASVEIVVSDEPETSEPKPIAENDRGAPDNRPTFRPRVLTGE